MRRTKIGLALGSGAAKGWAHIGVIRGLEQAGIHADIIAGCSIGSLVGASYACNSLDSLEQWVRSFSYWDVLRLMDVSWRRGGLLRGERVFKQVRQHIPARHIEECAVRFATVATNLSTGREIWFTKGDLHGAVRASCSIPGLLSPVRHNGYWLVDGGVVNPVPVSLARALGADIVIAVDLQHDAHLIQQNLLTSRQQDDKIPVRWKDKVLSRLGFVSPSHHQQPPGALEIMTTSIQVLENRLKLSRMAGDPPEVTLQPFCPQISTLDFHRAKEAIDAGSLSVEKHMDELLHLVKNND
ncbi:patatin-like phospholipase RssA [Mangrovibacter yixingensis]|uniref:patatin-like phospholipase RssA n=1 Tax=Mangrovibacter yixingensis TaxID=1529639 RepID=UPI001CF99B3C|nr:patatin-like phospholipase RssA [Mangrovibacter yixingensis]